MKIYFIFVVVLILCACGMPMAQRLDLVPGEPAPAYESMILVLQDLGYTIKHTDKASFTILAEKLTSGEALSAAIGGGPSMPFQASISMTVKDDQTSVSITITQPGKIIKSDVPKKLANEIMVKFKARISK